ncbi:rRNA-processing protein UTP23 homolog [Latimeria chalumnae]|uniref:rRNA-processing protein UTP23 homolog n=1 Tax=Latimeria chalumnae TaxID=7897 RepID=H3B3V8_LATCH|nr:PREDICTED: rRNA-processing protein UTP23 homolog [Latimeria chalumnae]XP_005994564.1 PREDICTED: rRNA-processing protein UTP23 homolog [Latimeria chalumnae]XP_005994565.1 PREDICTED: rRNA-processing protein UTP23 homolog [Latimeria chalumnae]XP_005994566.1 PREDICTED: rRNA-processing protein UTP23 homolog [Latimeria chalumnae]XP_005994567.1 PREDICTED: rRNA-processing protein UTP23 homolog [Latimeria chalumnae]XP_005994568.1 PREDICTED: rRNA-processing protein UTP23 homolog [Latimeria chalumnae]|eukprot:XP_005994563.1 PREDICTED: rRNA-processing protein UTP23 homolog [Latimeria chalumnae]
MKITRQKHAKKTIGFYKYNFNFREPFQVLIDGTFCQAALKNKIQIKEQLPKYFMGEVHLCTTNCVLKELESLGKELYGAKLIAQRFQVRNCAHFKNPVSASACLQSLIEGSNPHRYFVATQDQDLTTKVKKIAGVPLMFIIQNTMVLDKPSLKSIEYVQAMQANQLVSLHQQKSIQHLKEEQGLVKEPQHRGRKRKCMTGPNPLSCLKKKKKVQTPQQPAAEKKKSRQRRRARGKARGGAVPVSSGEADA